MLINNNCGISSVLSSMSEYLISKQLSERGIMVLDTVPSTNQYLIDNINYIRSGDVVVTEHQTAGRGRYGRSWITPKGQGICLSIYWKLYKKLLNTMELSLIISIVVATILKNLGASGIQVKWPNDLYSGHRKLAGILIETIIQNYLISHLIIGIGINVSICVRTKLKIKTSSNWIDLNDVGVIVNKNTLVSILVKKLRIILSQLESDQRLFASYY